MRQVADVHLPQVCVGFARAHSSLLASCKHTRRCFSLHLLNLVDLGLITPDHVDQCLLAVDKAGSGSADEDDGAASAGGAACDTAIL